jgi:hypothetical protein
MTTTVIRLNLRSPDKDAIISTGVADSEAIGVKIPNGACALVLDESVFPDLENMQSLLVMTAFKDCAVRLAEVFDSYAIVTTGTAVAAGKQLNTPKNQILVPVNLLPIASVTYTNLLTNRPLAVVTTFPNAKSNGLVDTCFERLIEIVLHNIIK